MDVTNRATVASGHRLSGRQPSGRQPSGRRPSGRAFPLGRQIAFTLVFKAVVLALLYLAFFGPDARPRVDAATLDAIIFGGGAQ